LAIGLEIVDGLELEFLQWYTPWETDWRLLNGLSWALCFMVASSTYTCTEVLAEWRSLGTTCLHAECYAHAHTLSAMRLHMQSDTHIECYTHAHTLCTMRLHMQSDTHTHVCVCVCTVPHTHAFTHVCTHRPACTHAEVLQAVLEALATHIDTHTHLWPAHTRAHAAGAAGCDAGVGGAGGRAAL
jgi:hypothetical protein